MAWAIINEKGEVINLIEYDGVSEYLPPENCNLIEVVSGTKTQKEIEYLAEMEKKVRAPDLKPTKAELLNKINELSVQIAALSDGGK